MEQSGRYVYVVLMCQQAVEKALKALHLKKIGREAPRSHNLVYLESLLDLMPSEQQLEFFAELTSYYLDNRYPTYKKKISELVDREKARVILKKTEESFGWLISLTG